jgi:uncharacterized damage-inducible protein DinB
MKVLSVNPQLQHLFLELEKQRNDILSLLTFLPETQLHQHPPGKWSIAQIISHLIASEQLSVNYLNKKIRAINELKNTTWVDDIKMNLLILSQRVPLKYKAPKAVVEHTVLLDQVQALSSRWDQTRKELEAVLEKFQDDQLRKKIFRHPVAGRLNILQTMRFFSEHIIHHTPQIKKLLRQS